MHKWIVACKAHVKNGIDAKFMHKEKAQPKLNNYNAKANGLCMS